MRLLFIGNSFTARNALPALIQQAAASADCRLDPHLVSVGGASLRRHWNSGVAAARIAAEPWDAVVLQEQSTLPIKNAARYHQNARLFVEPIREAGARLYLYETWHRAAVPETQQPLSEAVRAIAAEAGATVVPVGTAWQIALDMPGCPPLYDRDGSHPSFAGSCLAAFVFAGLLADAPVTWRPDDLDPVAAELLQTAAIRALS